MTRKGKQVTAATLLSLLILMADQIIKIAVKTHMYMHQSIHVTDWFQILFTENRGMAFGAEIFNKYFLTSFRIVAVAVLIYVIMRNIRKGVTWGMLLFNKAMGFVAILGVLALTGMIIRNSVILIDQIQKHLADGESPWDAVVDSAVLRFRPIMLTAAAAILGMVPLMTSAFWGPMAVAIASGLFVATVLTLLVLPTMYAAVYGVKKE